MSLGSNPSGPTKFYIMTDVEFNCKTLDDIAHVFGPMIEVSLHVNLVRGHYLEIRHTIYDLDKWRSSTFKDEDGMETAIRELATESDKRRWEMFPYQPTHAFLTERYKEMSKKLLFDFKENGEKLKTYEVRKRYGT